MKIMFASDIHGSAYYCRRMLEAYRDLGASRLVILGDILYDDLEMSSESLRDWIETVTYWDESMG